MQDSTLSRRFLNILWRLTHHVIFKFLQIFWHFTKWIWGTVIIGILVGGSLGNAAYTYLTTGHFDPIDIAHLSLVIFISTHVPLTVALFLSLVGITIASFWAQKRASSQSSVSTQSEYTLQPVNRLEPGNYKLFRYIPGAYISRDADVKVQDILHQRATTHNSTPDMPLGVCIFGRPTQGKTRLAWDAMQAELAGWILVRWPHERTSLFDFSAFQGKRLVLWLDDLHEFANPQEAVFLNDLPRRFIEQKIPLIILATCRDGDDSLQTQKYLGSLLERLESISLSDISMSNALDLAKRLTQEGVEVLGDEFDGTPGSLVLGARRMQARYLRLPLPTQSILKTMKLLRSAQIYSYPETRIRAVAHDLFAFDEREWRIGCESLDREDFIKLSNFALGERLLIPIADIYIEKVINDYPSPHATLVDDWIHLETCFKQQHDAEGLNSLGIAFAELLVGNSRANKQHAEACFRAALQVRTQEHAPSDWAMTQNNLASALSDQAKMAQGDQREQLLQKAVTAYRAALQVRTQEHAPSDWAMIQSNLALALHTQAGLAQSDQREEQLLREAETACRAALQVRTRERTPTAWANTQNNLAVILRAQAGLAQSNPREEQLLREAETACRAALQVRTQEHTPSDWASTQNNLAWVLHAQAGLAQGDQQKQLLREVVATYHAALQIYTQEHTPTDWANTQRNLAVALRTQAEMARSDQQEQLLQEAVTACRAALQIYTQEHTPTDWANTQRNLAVALHTQAGLAQEDQRKEQLLQEAVTAHRAALQIYTREHAPSDWAMTQNNLAVALRAQAEMARSDQQEQLLQEAVTAYRAALQIYTPEHAPTAWAITQRNLILLYILRVSVTEKKEKQCALLREAFQYVQDMCSSLELSLYPQQEIFLIEIAQRITQMSQELDCDSGSNEKKGREQDTK